MAALVALALVPLAGCEILVGNGPAGLPLPLDALRVTVINDLGFAARVDLVFQLNGAEVRRTTILLDPEASQTTDELVPTVTETLAFEARNAVSGSPDFGVLLGGRTLDRGPDFLPGDDLTILLSSLIEPPGADNLPPISNAGPDQAVGSGENVTLNGSASSDPEGGALSYQWTQIGEGPAVELSDSTAVQPSFTAPIVAAGASASLEFRLVVTDGDGATGSDTVSIRVEGPPAIEVTVQVMPSGPVPQGGSAMLSGEVIGGEPPYSYEWTAWQPGGAAGGGIVDGAVNPATWNAPAAPLGQWTFRLAVTDSQGNTGVGSATATLERDCNTNGIVDPAELGDHGQSDCDTNGLLDVCDRTAGAADCDEDGTLDVCVLDKYDCNTNGTVDYCEFGGKGGYDCNWNGRPDECDLAGNDCNTNSLPDDCEFFGRTIDCNTNFTPDECDVAAGAADCDTDGFPDVCQLNLESDCNTNDTLDVCELAGRDCDTNGWLDECQGGDDCNTNQVLDECERAIGKADCDWNGTLDACDLAGGAADCDSNTTLDYCDIALGAVDCDENGTPDVCELDAYDCNTNGTVDLCELAPRAADDTGGATDCNTNWVIDVCDIAGGAADCDTNGLPDVCDARWSDCDTNGVPDACAADDCNTNHTPDACDLIDFGSKGGPDCDTNHTLDVCEFGKGGDCNTNSVLDACDAYDCDHNGVPDECESQDCNSNGFPDSCELIEFDCNTNDLLDFCEMCDCNSNQAPDACDADCNTNGWADDCDVSSTADDCAAGISNLSAPFQIKTNGAADAWSDDGNIKIAADGQGHWVAVWDSNDSLGGTIGLDRDILVARSSDNGATWTPAVALNSRAAIDGAGDDDTSPFIVTDRHGVWIAMWASKGTAGNDSDIVYARSLDHGQTWSTQSLLDPTQSKDTATDGAVRFATDGRGRWVAGWASNRPDNDGVADFDMYVATSADHGLTWSPAALLNSDGQTDGTFDSGPQIATDAQGVWIAVWDSNAPEFGGVPGSDFEIVYSRSIDHGHTWSAKQTLNSNAFTSTGDDQGVQIAVDCSGAWLAVWTSQDGPDMGGTIEDRDILFSRSTDRGLSWSAALPANANAWSDSGRDFAPAIVADDRGSFVIAWHTFDTLGGTIGTDGDILVARTSDRGDTWSWPIPLNTDAGQDNLVGDQFPALAADQSGHVIGAWYRFSLAMPAAFDPDVYAARFTLPDCRYGRSSDENFDEIPDECER